MVFTFLLILIFSNGLNSNKNGNLLTKTTTTILLKLYDQANAMGAESKDQLLGLPSTRTT